MLNIWAQKRSMWVLTAEEAQSYPDNRPEFVDRFNLLLEKSVASFSHPPKIEAPLINMFKAEIVKTGTEVKAPLELTWSCYWPGKSTVENANHASTAREASWRRGFADPTEYA